MEIAFGVVGAAVFARLLVSMLYGVSPGDPWTYAGVSIALMFVALFAAWVPSWRAARVDPRVALREASNARLLSASGPGLRLWCS
jgi:putative ABC transport system permease protein